MEDLILINSLQAFLCLSAVLAAASADLGFHAHPHVAHHAVAHAPVLPAPLSAAVAPVNYGANKPVNGYGHGQVSHQSVSKPYQGEHRSTTQSKAFGAHAAVVADGKSRTSLNKIWDRLGGHVVVSLRIARF